MILVCIVMFAPGRALDREERLHETLQASVEMVRPTVYGQIIIFLVFVPCLSFQGVEGKMFSPMVITLMLALGAAFLASLTFVPAMVAILVRGKVAEREVYVVRAAKRLYAPALRAALTHPFHTVISGVGIFAAALFVLMELGRRVHHTGAPADGAAWLRRACSACRVGVVRATVDSAADAPYSKRAEMNILPLYGIFGSSSGNRDKWKIALLTLSSSAEATPLCARRSRPPKRLRVLR